MRKAKMKKTKNPGKMKMKGGPGPGKPGKKGMKGMKGMMMKPKAMKSKAMMMKSKKSSKMMKSGHGLDGLELNPRIHDKLMLESSDTSEG